MDKHFCPYCMTPVPEGESCPSCGLTAGNYVPSPHHLPPGTVLLGRYLVGRVLGEGGFGITYIGCDLRLELKVAIKEYYPVDRAMRNSAASLNVSGFIGPSSKSFERGRQKFLDEARTMARMDKQQVIVGVRDFFEANNTAYIVMEYVEGTTFSELKDQRGGRIPPGELFRIIEPLFGALSALHENGFIHRDISPDNLMLENGEVRLLDFGCAREAVRGTETMTIALKHGYAPLEQYQQKGQGPWTDIYALCATIYLCLTGQAPPQALDRIAEDNLVLPSKLGVNISPAQERPLMKGLRIQPNRRYQTVKELWAALYTASDDDAEEPEVETAEVISVEEPAEIEPEVTEDAAAEETEERENPQPKWLAWLKKHRAAVASAAGALVLAAVLLIVLWPKGAATPDMTDNTPRESGAPVFAPAEEGDPGETEPPDAPAIDPDDRFANAVVLENSDPERFARLMEDDGVEAVILRAGIPLDTARGRTTITKPVRIDAGTETGSNNLTVTETGFLEVRGKFHFDGFTRLEGSGERVRVADGGHADYQSVFIADAAENLGNLDPPAENLTVLPDEQALFADAVTVTSYAELEAAVRANRPVVLAADIDYPERWNSWNEWLWISTPVLIPEGVTLTTWRNSFDVDDNGATTSPGIQLNGATVVNRGTIRGNPQGMNGATLINFGALAESPGGLLGSSIWFDTGSRIVNFGEIRADDVSRMWEDTSFFNLGTLYAYDFYLVGGFMMNLGEVYAYDGGGGVGFRIQHGAELYNLGSVTAEKDGQVWNDGYIRNSGGFLLKNGSHMRNALFENGATFTAERGAEIDPEGSVFFTYNPPHYGNYRDSVSCDMGSTGQIVYEWRVGYAVDVHTAEELTAALSDRSVGSVRFWGSAELGSDLYVSKDLDIVGQLVFAPGAKLTVERACVNISNGAPDSLLQADAVELYDQAMIFVEGGTGGTLDVRDGGTLEMTRSFIGGSGELRLGAGAAVTLRDSSAVAFSGPLTLDELHATLESGSVLTTSSELRIGNLNSASELTADGGCLRFIGDATLTNCRVDLKNGGEIRTGTRSLTFSDCAVSVDESSRIDTNQTSMALRRATTLENRGEMETWAWGEAVLSVEAQSRIVNAGYWGCGYSSFAAVRGTIENSGDWHFPWRWRSDIEGLDAVDLTGKQPRFNS